MLHHEDDNALGDVSLAAIFPVIRFPCLLYALTNALLDRPWRKNSGVSRGLGQGR